MQIVFRSLKLILEERPEQLFAAIKAQPELIGKLVRHMCLVEVAQLLHNMINMEFNLKVSWSDAVDLPQLVIDHLLSSPVDNFASVGKFFADLVAVHPADSPLIRNLVTRGNAVIVCTMQSLIAEPAMAENVVELLDVVILSIVERNNSDAAYYRECVQLLQASSTAWQQLFLTRSLRLAFAGALLVQSLVKHRFYQLAEPLLEGFVDLLFRFKLANILHEVVMSTLSSSFLMGRTELLAPLLGDKVRLADKVARSLTEEAPTGNHAHLLVIANAIRISNADVVVRAVKGSEAWQSFVPSLDNLTADMKGRNKDDEEEESDVKEEEKDEEEEEEGEEEAELEDSH